MDDERRKLSDVLWTKWSEDELSLTRETPEIKTVLEEWYAAYKDDVGDEDYGVRNERHTHYDDLTGHSERYLREVDRETAPSFHEWLKELSGSDQVYWWRTREEEFWPEVRDAIVELCWAALDVEDVGALQDSNYEAYMDVYMIAEQIAADVCVEFMQEM